MTARSSGRSVAIRAGVDGAAVAAPGDVTPAATRATVVVCSLPRSGSWLLAAALDATGLAGNPREYMLRELRQHYADRWGIETSAPKRRWVEAMLGEATGPDGVAGLKIHWQDFAHLVTGLRAEGAQGSDREVVESVLPDPRYVRIVRRDRVRQALSWARGLATGHWWHVDGGAAEPEWDPDMEKVEALHDVLVAQDALWRRYFDSHGISALEVVYEDLLDEWEPTIRRVLDHLGLEAPADLTFPPPALRSQSDGMSAQWLASWRHLRTRMGAPVEPAQPPAAPAPARETASVTVSRVPFEERPLGDLLAHRRWLRRDHPFPHVVATDVFRPEAYAELDAAFAALLDLGEDAGIAGFSRNVPGFDVFGHTFKPGSTGPLTLFAQRPWHDALSKVAGIEGTGHVFCGLHHHGIGSASGGVHNDLNPGWFAHEAEPGGVLLADHARCIYSSGETRDPEVTPVRTIRGVAMLFFLHNGPWTPGDGGELGLYASAADGIEHPTVAVPPIDNSLVLFECTPFSFHGFIGNRRAPRNSLIMWVHRREEDVEERWGPDAVVEWTGARKPARAVR